MFTINVQSKDLLKKGIKTLTIHEPHDIDCFSFPPVKKLYDKKSHSYYLEKVLAFDIETSTVEYEESYAAYMYVWQCAVFDENTVFIGRTWEEYNYFITAIQRHYQCRIVVYVHNLSYESQFMRLEHNVVEYFCTDERYPVRLLTDKGIEYRCSWKLSNMSLAKFTEKSDAKYTKQGDYNYREVVLPSDKLSVSQYEYQYCDAAGLIESINKRLEQHNVLTIPLTSTGYVRERVRKALKAHEKENRAYFLRTEIGEDEYVLCKMARRGGNTHANAYYSGQIIKNVRSRDKKSSYPYEMCTKHFPMGLRMESPHNFDWHYEQGRHVVFEVAFEGIELKDPIGFIPYLSVAKARIKKNVIADNGRLIKADLYVCAMTEVDYTIVTNQYTFSARHILQMCTAESEMLPRDLRKTIMAYFAEKEALTGKDEYLRDRKKNEINGIFGMMLTDMIHDEIIYNNKGDELYERKKMTDIESELVAYYKNRKNFAAYQQGIYVTAYARASLQEGLDITAEDTIYTDTDSNKYIGDHESEFEKINERIKEEAETFDVKPYLPSGEYLGVWEYEGMYREFATCGAKKYGYIAEDGEFHITIAGCNKEKGKLYIEKKYGLKAFTESMYRKVVVDEEHSGRLTAYHNDWDEKRNIIVRGKKLIVGSNTAMIPTTYSLGITTEYSDYVKSVKKGYDNI